MKVLLFILMITFLTACTTNKPADIENDIFISSLGNNFDSNGKFILKDTAKAVYFSKDFWNYFIRTHPKASAIIFIRSLYDTTNDYIILPDTSYCFYNADYMSSFYFQKLLADDVNGQEKNPAFGSSFFIIPDDTTGSAVKEKRIQNRLKDYKVTPMVSKEFQQLKSILIEKDTSEHYVIIFKKAFVDKIYKIYE